MKGKIYRSDPISIQTKRWAAYAAAGAATALGGGHSLEAAIHYSGRLHIPFPPDEFLLKTFQLDQQSNALEFQHNSFGSGRARFNIFGGFSSYGGAFRGQSTVGRFTAYVSRLSLGQNISGGSFKAIGRSYPGIMAGPSGQGQWLSRGIGYIGFRFKTGAGFQYGWARIRMDGSEKNNAFKVLDWAYADVGEPILAGQRSSAEQTPDQAVEQNSLGVLALGAAGLVAWRKSRSRTAR